jgi:sarcosine oxidase subunit gamma
MSNVVSALNGASFTVGIATITEIGVQGMITLRGDLSSVALQKAAKTVTGLGVPAQGHMVHKAGFGICWMSTDELLILCPYGEVAQHLASLSTALADEHALAVDVSDARASFTVAGPHARDVMAKLAPVDLRVSAFVPGMFRRTRMAQVAAAFWMPDADSFQIVCFRSNAQYMFDLLGVAAQVGSEVGHLGGQSG